VRWIFAIGAATFTSIALLQSGLSGRANSMGIGVPAEGRVVVQEASLQLDKASWELDARIEIELPPAIRAGLDSGVPLEFVLTLELSEQRAFRPDPTLLNLRRRYELVYYDLTRHYRVRSFDDGTGRNYRSLPTALRGLGDLDGVPLGPVDKRILGRGKLMRARLELSLDERALPLPLRSPGGSSWKLPSERLEWTVPAT